MAIGWYIIPYSRRVVPSGHPPARYPAIDDYTAQILATGGQWAESEVLGNRCLIKVRASIAVLQALATEYKRLPKDRLDDSLADLSTAAKRALRDELEDMGYTLAEIRARFGDDLGIYTLRDVLGFMASRRRKPRYDQTTDTIVLDGSVQSCRPVNQVDREVSA